MAVSDDQFWSWQGVAAIVAILIVTAKSVDALLKQRHKVSLLIAVAQVGEQLSTLPVRQWELTIAAGVVSFWKRFGTIGVEPVRRVLDLPGRSQILLVLALLGTFIGYSRLHEKVIVPWYVDLLLLSLLPYGVAYLSAIETRYSRLSGPASAGSRMFDYLSHFARLLDTIWTPM